MTEAAKITPASGVTSIAGIQSGDDFLIRRNGETRAAPATALYAYVTLEQFGALADGSDDAAAWEAAMDYLEAQGGGTLLLVPGKTYSMTNVTHASNVRVEMNGATLAVHADTPQTGGDWYVNRDISADGTRACIRPQIIGPGTFDGSAWAFDRWLSQADGTAVTDPEADYVMGTGALASGISGTSLTAVLTGDAVTSVTINNGGAGWKGHPTQPYVPDDVLLLFSGGGGTGAQGYATISGGTLTSVTITDGGKDYTSAPTVTAQGGYADIDLLVDPSVDRRNPDYGNASTGVSFAKCDHPLVENVTFTGFRRRTLSEGGSIKPVFRNIEFVNCGKKDGAFHCIWLQSYGTPGGGDPFYAPTEDALVENIRCVDGIERSAILFSPAKGGTLRKLYADGCGESTVFINANALCNDGGKALIEDCHLANNVLTDIAGQLIEHNGSPAITIRNCLLEGASFQAVACAGGTNVIYESNTFKNNGTGLSTDGLFIPYGPFSERYDFGADTMPIAGRATRVETKNVIGIGGYGAVGGGGTRFEGNVFLEDRAVYPTHVFEQGKSGTSSIADDVYIRRNDITGIPSGMGFLNTDITSVWLANMPLHISDNPGHVSEAPVIEAKQVTATGSFTIDCGFRPRWVEVFADVNNGLRMRAWHGGFGWSRDGVRNDFGHLWASDGTNVGGQIRDVDVVRVVDPNGFADQCLVEFVAWTETGFTLNTTTYNETTNIRFVCHS